MAEIHGDMMADRIRLRNDIQDMLTNEQRRHMREHMQEERRGMGDERSRAVSHCRKRRGWVAGGDWIDNGTAPATLSNSAFRSDIEKVSFETGFSTKWSSAPTNQHQELRIMYIMLNYW